MNRALLFLAALALPLIGLGGMWLSADRLIRQGTEWDVPIRGYDPRDLLQGHYVQFQYDWPGLEAEGGPPGADLCIFGHAPQIDRVAPAANAVEANCNLVRSSIGLDSDFRPFATSGRIYVDQHRSRQMQQQLLDPKLQGVLRFRLRPDGQIVPIDLSFRPRPSEPRATP